MRKEINYDKLKRMWNKPLIDEWEKAKKHYWDVDSVKKNYEVEERLSNPAKYA